MPRTVVACLWAGNDLPGYSANKYSIHDVIRLWRGVRRFVEDGELLVLCDRHYFLQLSDADAVFPFLTPEETRWEVARTCKIRQMLGEGVGGWSHVMEAFHPGLKLFEGSSSRRVLLVGLDTIFVNDSTWLFNDFVEHPTPILLPPDPHKSTNPPCDAVVLYNEAGAEIAWREYVRAKQQPVFPHLYFEHPSEMVLLQHLFASHPMWGMLEDEPRRLLSYKCHVRGKLQELPPECSIVYFHGSPKPSDLPPSDIVIKAMQ